MDDECKQPLIGVNIMYSKHVLEKEDGFKSDLGRKGNRLISGEETLLNKKLIKSGYKFYYDPEIIVQHHINKSRISRKWLIKRYFWGGYTNACTLSLNENLTLYKVINKFFIYLYRYILNIILIPFSFIIKPKYHYLIYLTRAFRSLGFIYGLLIKKA